MGYRQVLHYRVYEMPKGCKYALKGSIDIELERDSDIWLANCADKRLFNYAVGNTIRQAIRDLLEELADDYKRYGKLIKRKKLGKGLIKHYETLDELLYKPD